jgi:CubicO group peptidase (beta-lactamase class C family)
MKRLGLISLVCVLVVAVVVGVFYGHFVERIIFALDDDKDSMAENFRMADSIFNHHLIAKSSQPQPLPEKLRKNIWPETFESHGETINSDDFLEQVQTTGLVILEDGKVIYEDYWHGLSASQRQFAFSVAKSMTSVMVGFAIDDGLIDDVNDPVVKYLPKFKNSAWDKATIANMLEMSSGVDFDEDYARTDTDMARFQKGFLFDKPIEPFLLTLSSKHEPGIKQGYNSMETQMAGMLLSAVLGEKSISDYMHEKLWQPLGAQDDATWTTDITGQEVTIGGLSMSLRDLAKVGQLMLQRGQWQGQKLLSESWVLESTTPVKPYQLPGRDNPLSEKPFGYGYLWWTPVDPNGREFYASGLHGQYLFVSEPSKLVVGLYSANPAFNEKPDWWKERYEDFFQAIAIKLKDEPVD